jgi:hypothetical protein
MLVEDKVRDNDPIVTPVLHTLVDHAAEIIHRSRLNFIG